MAEMSYFWGGTVTGDATEAPYSSDEWGDLWSLLFTYDRTTQGVIDTSYIGGIGTLANVDLSTMLEVTNPAGTTIEVDLGAAIVDGKVYVNTAVITDPDGGIAAPGAGTNYYRVVLQKDPVNQTVRCALLGPDPAAYPALTQNDGGTWEIPLAKVSITAASTVTVTDERSTIGHDGDHLDIDWDPSNYTPDSGIAEADDVDDLSAHLKGIDDVLGNLEAAIDGDHLDIDWDPTYYTPDASPAEAADVDDLAAHLKGIDDLLGTLSTVTKEIFYEFNYFQQTVTPPYAGCQISIGEHPVGMTISTAGTDYDAWIGGYFPNDFASISEMVLVLIVAAVGASTTVEWWTNYGAAGEDYNQHTDNNSDTTDYTGRTDEIVELDISGEFAAAAAGDYFGMRVRADRRMYVKGIRLRYST